MVFSLTALIRGKEIRATGRAAVNDTWWIVLVENLE